MKSFLRLLLVLLFTNIHSQYRSSWYNLDNGLPQNSIKDIIKDRYGFIWLSTENGIVKYDGLSFIVYNDLPFSNLHFENFHGNISQDSIINFNNLQENQILIKNRNLQIITKSSFSKAYMYWRKKNLKKITKCSPASAYDDNMQYYVETDHGIYFLHNNEVIFRDKYEKTDTKIKVPFKNPDLNNLCIYNNTLIINDITRRRTYKIYKKQLTVFAEPTLLNDPDSKVFWHQLNNQIFVVNTSNIYYLKNYESKLNLKLLTHYKNIGNSQFNSIYYDKNFDRLYLGSFSKGLNILQLSSFYNSQKKDPFSDNIQYSSLPYDQSSVIDASGTVMNREGQVKQYKFGLNGHQYMSYDNDGNIICRSGNYLLRRLKKTEYSTCDTISYYGLRTERIYKHHDLFAVCSTDFTHSNLRLFQNDQFKKEIYTIKLKGVINTFLSENKEELFIGCNNALYLFSKQSGKITPIIKNVNVKSIIRTADKQLWITTRKDGFFLIRNNRAVKMPLDKNKHLSQAHYILYDQKGYYWISSNNGLFRTSCRQLLKYSTDNKTYVHYYRFSKNDGLATNEFNGGSYPNAYRLQDGDFVFPSIEGFVFFNPLSVKIHYPNEKKIYIERARTRSGDNFYFSKKLTLKNNYKSADIYIDIPYYSDSENLIIDAKLEGDEDSHWESINTKNERKYTLNGIAYGSYILRFRILTSPEGKYEYRQLSIDIEPLFYQNYYFKALLLFTLLIILGIIFHLRTLSLRKKIYNISYELIKTSKSLEEAEGSILKEAEHQKKMVEAISHDIATPIKFIAMLSGRLEKSDNAEIQKKYFESIYKASEELYKFTLNLKKYNDLYKTADEPNNREEYFIEEILEAKKKLFDEVAKENGSMIAITAGKTKCTNNKNILSCIIHNLIDNATKNTIMGIIHLTADKNEELLIVNISDTGPGMSDDQLNYYNKYANNEDITFKNYGHGLHMVISLVKKINAKIMFHRRMPQGTSIKIILKTNTYEP